MTSIVPPTRALLPDYPAGGAPPAPPQGGALPGAGASLRYLEALLRFKWLIAATTIAGTALGVVWSRRTPPRYDVHATIWISAETPQARAAGPIRPEGLLNTSSWPDLIGSYSVLDSVARKSHLYIKPEHDAPRALFTSFDIRSGFRTGQFELRVDPDRNRYELLSGRDSVLERGTIGDSVGLHLGFLWAPTKDAFHGRSSVRFALTTLRDAAVDLRSRLDVSLPRESSLLHLTLSGIDPQQTTATMDTLVAQFVGTAAWLKNRNLVEFAKALEEQLNYATEELRRAEIALEEFRVRTITLPSEGGTVAAGLEVTRDPVLRHFFDLTLQLDSVRSDRESLERTLAAVRAHQLTPGAFWSLPSVHGAKDLTDALTRFDAEQAALDAALQTYTDQHRIVIEQRRRIAQLQEHIIPDLATALLENLRRREQDLQARVDGSSRDLRQIPTRTIEEMRLRRNVDVRQALYTNLKSRYEEARLSEASALPDLSVLDYPAVPQAPVRSTGLKRILLAIAISFGTAVTLALLLDTVDRRFRHPAQVTRDLGLDIVGVVPRIRPGSKQTTEQAWQVTEAFRTLRLGVQPWQDESGHLRLTITSPGTGDGKSLVAANLGCSFAQAGYRTLLIDGDVRRGALHAVFGLAGQPGLTDFLAEHASLEDVLRPTESGLTVIPTGTRGRRAPELVASGAMPRLLSSLAARFDVILIDSAPLNAGVDAFILGSLTTNLLMVMRTGVTDRKLADAKLRIIDRFPIRLVGAVINDVQTTGAYRYYAYRYSDEPVATDDRRIQAPAVL